MPPRNSAPPQPDPGRRESRHRGNLRPLASTKTSSKSRIAKRLCATPVDDIENCPSPTARVSAGDMPNRVSTPAKRPSSRDARFAWIGNEAYRPNTDVWLPKIVLQRANCSAQTVQITRRKRKAILHQPPLAKLRALPPAIAHQPKQKKESPKWQTPRKCRQGYLIGAGPGDPESTAPAAPALLAAADVVLHDRWSAAKS